MLLRIVGLFKPPTTSTLSRLGFHTRIKNFYNPGTELTCEIEDFQIPKFWEEMNTLQNNFSEKDEANDRD